VAGSGETSEGETLILTRSLEELRDVRQWLVDRLQSGPTGRVGVAEIAVMANELVTNVIRHTSSVPVLTLVLTTELVRIEVRDGDPRLPKVLPADIHRPSGNGMRIVDAWADRWGTDVDPDGGKTVWFTVDR
jgi:anti-sigma regulatory factor (Ser/Thr protein kinase)